MTVIGQMIDHWRFRRRAWVRDSGGQLKQLTIRFTIVLHCWSVHFYTLYDVLFRSPRRQWWRLSLREKTDVGHKTRAYHKAA